MVSTTRRRWRAGTLGLMAVALGSMLAAYHYATGLELGGGVFQQIGLHSHGGHASMAQAPLGDSRTCAAGANCRPANAENHTH